MTSTRHPRPRLRLESFEPREVPATLTTGVDNDNYDSDLDPTDWDGTDNLLSLQEAIRKVNEGADSVIDFNGLTVQRTTPTDDFPDVRNYVTVTGGTLDGMTNRSGLVLRAGGWVHDMTFVRADGTGLTVYGEGWVEDNFFGTDNAGTPGLGNGTGVSIELGGDGGTYIDNVFTGNLIGMRVTGDFNTIRYNVISGNGGGIGIGGGDDNWVANNMIGVAADGVTPLPNTGNAVTVFGFSDLIPPARGPRDVVEDLRQAVGNYIGGSSGSYRNIIAGFTGAGVHLAGQAVETRVIGNYIGLTAAGTVLPGGSAGDGILLTGISFNNVIGGSGGSRNWIAGVQAGVRLTAADNKVLGNVIGLQADGTAPAAHRNTAGIVVERDRNVIGRAGYRNIIAGIDGPGVQISGQENRVQNNWIGLDLTGKTAVGNTGAGIELLGVINTIGGSGAGNVIAGNGGPGLWVHGDDADRNVVRNNTIGLNAAGAVVPLAGGARGNGGGGVLIEDGADLNSIGVPRAGNVISGNTGAGIRISGAGTDGTTVYKNSVGTNAAGTGARGNDTGIVVEAGAALTQIGDGTRDGRNLVSGNTGHGILLGDGATTATVSGNRIGTNLGGTGRLANGGDGVHIGLATDSTLVGNTIAFNTGFGIRADAGTGNTFDANSIYSNGPVGISLAAGANGDIGRPTIQDAARTSNRVTIEGLAATRPTATLRVQLFGNPKPSGTDTVEGKRFLGEIEVTTDATGAFTAVFAVKVPSGFRVLTITVTDEAGNTSEFSDPRSV